MHEGMVILSAVVGSRLYGTETADSDTDVRSVLVLPLKHVLSPFRPNATKRLFEGETDRSEYEVRAFCRLCAEGHPLALETLIGRAVTSTPEGDELRALLPVFLSRRCSEAFLHYERNKERKFRTESAPGKWKHASSMVRILLQLRRLLTDGTLSASFSDDEKAMLRAIVRGEMTDAAVMARVFELERECKMLAATAALPPEPDVAAIEKFLLRAYLVCG